MNDTNESQLQEIRAASARYEQLLKTAAEQDCLQRLCKAQATTISCLTGALESIKALADKAVI